MNTVRQPVITAPLRECCLICNGNAHRPDLCAPVSFMHNDVLHEALLPEIRMTAQLIAASRHDWTTRSPEIFTEEADWFAARILVLHVRAFHLNVEFAPMLHLANKRAAEFAKKRGLPFQAADIRPSLHTQRPKNVLLMACEIA